MKITKQHLKQIIKEEYKKLNVEVVYKGLYDKGGEPTGDVDPFGGAFDVSPEEPPIRKRIKQEPEAVAKAISQPRTPNPKQEIINHLNYKISLDVADHILEDPFSKKVLSGEASDQEIIKFGEKYRLGPYDPRSIKR